MQVRTGPTLQVEQDSLYMQVRTGLSLQVEQDSLYMQVRFGLSLQVRTVITQQITKLQNPKSGVTDKGIEFLPRTQIV